jgi:hypothetical protein
VINENKKINQNMELNQKLKEVNFIYRDIFNSWYKEIRMCLKNNQSFLVFTTKKG